jgi:hypothetical protein
MVVLLVVLLLHSKDQTAVIQYSALLHLLAAEVVVEMGLLLMA